MSLYELHKLMFDIRHNDTVKTAFQSDPEAVYGRYALHAEELAALRAKDVYRLHKLGANPYLLAPFAQLLGFELMELGDLLRASAAAERPHQPG